jgi:hypothetical protein
MKRWWADLGCLKHVFLLKSSHSYEELFNDLKHSYEESFNDLKVPGQLQVE